MSSPGISRQRPRTSEALPPAGADPTAPAPWEIGGLLILVLFYSTPWIWGDDSYGIVNTAGPLALAAILYTGALRTVRMHPAASWTALVWFRISTATYLGLGSVVHHFFSDATLMEIYKFYFAEASTVAKVNVLTAVSTLTILATAALAGKFKPYKPDTAILPHEGSILLIVAGATTAVGYAIKYLIVFPHAMGAFGDVVLPGMIGSLALLTGPGLFLLTVWVTRFAPALFPVIAGAVMLDASAGMLRFSKTDTLMPLLMFLLAWLYAKASFFRIASAAAIFVTVFHYSQPLVEFGRRELSLSFGAVRQGGFDERIRIVQKYFSQGAFTRESQGSLVRISYIFAAAPAIDFYDNGKPGDSLSTGWAVLIPRALWPDKPVFDDAARYTQMINGSVSSSTWMGIFAESYWNFGWPGIPIALIPAGLAYFFLSRYALYILNTRRWLHFPIVFLGMYAGVRSDGMLILDIFASCFIAFVLHFAANAGTSFLQSFFSGSRAELRPANPNFRGRRP